MHNQARIQDLGEGGARFLGTKLFTKFRNKSSKFRYNNRAKRDKVREAPKIFVPDFVPLGILKTSKNRIWEHNL